MKFNKLGKFGVVGEDRQTGKSTGIALQCIGKALSSPGVSISIRDHYDTIQADRFLFDQVQLLCAKLELKFIIFNRSTLSIVYDIYTDVEAPETVLSNGRLLKRGEKVTEGQIYDGFHYY